MSRWKLGTFFIGAAWLIWGARTLGFPDWDVGVSLLMAVSTFLTADKAVGWFLSRDPWKIVGAVLATWWGVDGSYWLYWSLVNPAVMIREGQWPMSLCLYLLCGFIWRIDPMMTLHQIRERVVKASGD